MVLAPRILIAFSLSLLLSNIATANSIQVVVYGTDPAPDANGVTDGMMFLGNPAFETPALSESGEVAFRSFLDGANDSFNGLFASPQRFAPRQVMRDGQSLSSDEFEGAPFSLAVNDLGDVAYKANTSALDLNRNSGLFRTRASDGLVQELAREGDTVANNNGIFGQFIDSGTPAEIYHNSAGQVAFFIDLNQTSAGDGVGAIYRAQQGTQAVEIAREGSTTIAGREITDIGLPSMNESGNVAFLAELDDSLNPEGVFRGNGTQPVTTIATRGQLTGDGAGTTFQNFENSAVPINNNDEVAFVASLLDDGGFSAGQGIFLGNGTTLTEIARSGDEIPGQGTDSISFITRDVALNDANQVAFVAGIPSLGGARALFRGDTNGFMEIARPGQALPDENGDLTTGEIGSFLSFAMNDAGQIAFMISELDQSYNERNLFFYDDANGITPIARVGDLLEFPLAGGGTVSGLIEGIEFMSVTMGTPYISQDRWGINNDGVVAFQFLLDNGNEGIALWSGPASEPDPGPGPGNGTPEPSSIALFAAAFLVLTATRRSQRYTIKLT